MASTEQRGLSFGNQLMRELQQSIYDAYDLPTLQYKGLRSNSEPIQNVPTIHIPNFGNLVDVEQIADSVTWSFVIPEELEESLSFTSSKRDTPRHLKYKIRHEFVSEALDQFGTDRPLTDFFPRLLDDDDILTPDIIHQDAIGCIHVIEISTIRSLSSNQSVRVFREKHFKYEQALTNRTVSMNSPVTYTPIIVSSESVWSNIHLPPTLINELLVRMKIATALENCAAGKGFLMQKTEDEELLSQMANEIKVGIQNLEDYQKRHPEKIYITNQFIGKVMQSPNEDHVSMAYSFSRMEAKKEIIEQRSIKTDPRTYLKELNSTKERRQDSKPIFGLPMMTPLITKSSSLPLRRTQGEQGPHSPLIKLWNEALDVVHRPGSKWEEEDHDKLLKEALEVDKNNIQEMIRKRHLRRSKYHVADLSKAMDNKCKKYLARDGVGAKKYSQEQFLSLRKKQQKMSFSGLTDTKDIAKFIEDSSIYEKSKDSLTDPQIEKLNLLLEANIMAGNSKSSITSLSNWAHTRIFKCLDFFSDVAMELSISVKSHTNANEFIVKKLKYYDAYLLIKTTNSRSHIFVSMFFPTPNNCDILCDLPMGSKIRTNNAYITPFTSFRVDKLENVACCSSKFLSLISFWSHFYGIDIRNIDDFKSHSQATMMMNLSILILLEDKAETEESITITRYMYMEIFKGDFTVLRPDPFKMLEKFSTKPRSRLNLYLIKKIINNFSIMNDNPPIKMPQQQGIKLTEGEDSLPADEWQGLLNCFTGGPVNSSTKVINLCYLGYLKNKNEVAQDNSDYKLIEKVLEEEISLSIPNKTKSYGEVETDVLPGPKQFSSDCIMKGCSLMEKRLSNTLGPNWKTVLEREILENLAKSFTTEIATLKASSPFEHTKQPLSTDLKNNGDIHRIRVIEAIAIKISKFQVNPMCQLGEFISLIEGSIAGIIADLFKKNQHGGLREIYVLSIESRVVQLFIETISRTLCSYFEEETLTHPENKLHLLDKHKVRSAKLAKALNTVYFDLCNSSDKKRWNQNFVMTAMSIPLFRMTTPIFHNPIKRILNLWADKLIKIPPAVCNLLMNKIPLSSDVYMDLLDNFWGPKNKRPTRSYMMSMCGSFINTTTGMMQGILHYLSSLVHVAFLHAGSYYTKMLLRHLYKDNRFTMTQVCSSDDSATILSAFSESDLEKLKVKNLKMFVDCEISLLALTKFCQFFCMRESLKSTIALPDYVEFNSEFIFRNTVARPIIKICCACITITESESFISRFHTMYNLISDLYSCGFSSLNTHFCQLAQGWLHYSTLGSSTNGLFFDWVNLIKNFPSSTHGFFLLDSEKCSGLMGFSFSRWNSYQSHPLLYQSAEHINYNELEPTPDGGVAPSLVVKHGDLKKWHQLMDRIDNNSLNPCNKVLTTDKATGKAVINDSLLKARQDKINKHYELLFRPAQSLPEVKLKLLMKASMPGVARSLGKGNPFMQALAMSVYAINTHCFTKTSITFANLTGILKKGKVTKKISLLYDLKDQYEKTLKIEAIDEEKQKRMINVMFPLHKRYEEAVSIIDDYKNCTEIPVHNIRQRKSLIIIQPKMLDLPITLMKTCSRKWFGIILKSSDRLFERCWLGYKVTYPWLSDTFEDTLVESPFQTPIELYYFIARQESRSRRIVLNGPGIFSNIFQGQLSQLIRKHCVNGHILERSGIERNKYKSSFESTLAKVSLSLQIPLKKVRHEMCVRVLKEVNSSIDDMQSLSLRPRNEARLLVISSFVKGTLNEKQVLDVLNQTDIGTLVSFTKEQRKVGSGKTTKWIGEGECLVFIEGITLKIRMKDDTAVSITTNRWRTLRTNPGILRSVLNELGLRALKKHSFDIGSVAKFQGIRYVPMSSMGTPIFHDETMKKTFLEPKSLRFRVYNGKCGIYTRLRGGCRPLIEIKSSIKDCPSLSNQQSCNNIWQSWQEFRPLHIEACYKFIRAMKSKSEGISRSTAPGEEAEEWENLRLWIKTSLESRLKYMGLGYTQQDFTTTIRESDVIEEEMDDEELEAMLFNLMMDDNGDDLDFLVSGLEAQAKDREETTAVLRNLPPTDLEDEVKKIQESDFIEDSEQFALFQSLFHNWETEACVTEPSIYRNTSFDYLYLHPLWDNLILACNTMDPMFFSKVLQGITVSSDTEFSELIMDVMSIKKKHMELNITQRFARFKSEEDVLGEMPIGMREESDPVRSGMEMSAGTSGMASNRPQINDPWWNPDSDDESD